MKILLSIFKKLLKILFFLVTLFILYVAIFQKQWFWLAFDFLTVKIDWLGYWNYLLAFIFALWESIPILWTFTPGQNIVIIIWIFFSNNIVWIAVIASLWAILWDYLAFIAGKTLGKESLEKHWDIVWIWTTEINFLEKQVEKNGAWFLILGKFNAFVHNYMPFIAWTMQMENRKFWFFNIIGSTIRATSMIILWVFFKSNYQIILENLSKIILILVIIVILYIFFFKKEEFKKYVELKEKELEKKSKITK